MRYRAVRLAGEQRWRIQLSERPAIVYDCISVMLEGVECFFLRKTYATGGEAEQAIGRLARDMEVREWKE